MTTEKSLAPTRNRIPAAQSVARRYTDFVVYNINLLEPINIFIPFSGIHICTVPWLKVSVNKHAEKVGRLENGSEWQQTDSLIHQCQRNGRASANLECPTGLGANQTLTPALQQHSCACSGDVTVLRASRYHGGSTGNSHVERSPLIKWVDVGARSKILNVGSNLTRGMDIRLHSFCVCLSCLAIG